MKALLLIGAGCWVAWWAITGATRNADALQREYESKVAQTKQQLASAQRFGLGAMAQAKREERKRREIERKLWLAEGRLPGVTE